MSAATECPRCTAPLKLDDGEIVGCENGCALFLIRQTLGLDPPFVPSNGNGSATVEPSVRTQRVEPPIGQYLESSPGSCAGSS